MSNRKTNNHNLSIDGIINSEMNIYLFIKNMLARLVITWSPYDKTHF